MKVGVIVFPGSNCDHDCYYACKHVLGVKTSFVWHKQGSLGDQDLVIVPGGFSYGDYLRSGAIASNSPIMRDLVRFARQGGLVLGICNGFQVLTEAGLLPGALMRNAGLRFVCDSALLEVGTERSAFTSAYARGQQVDIPVAHHDGNYYCTDEELRELEGEDRVAFRYLDNPNGSRGDIAGILNAERNVLGMMPHPERVAESELGSDAGLPLFQSLKSFVENS